MILIGERINGSFQGHCAGDQREEQSPYPRVGEATDGSRSRLFGRELRRGLQERGRFPLAHSDGL
jgi:hypothetical protein